MKKIWLFFIPLLFSLLSCEGFTTTGSNDPYSNPCYVVSRKNANSYTFFMELNCPYGEKCKTSFSFLGRGAGDTLDGRCFSEYVLNFITNDSSIFAHSGTPYPLALTPDNHVKFTFVDEDNVEKKYDIDLSGIINSYTVRDDSVDVNVMKGCNLWLFSCRKGKVAGYDLSDVKYTFSRTKGCDEEGSYECYWQNQGPLKKDNLDIHAKIYWKE
jgi:hypothetical protein